MSNHRGTPAAEIEIDDALVRQLLKDQHPDLAELPLSHVNGGWDNEIFRLGDKLAVRIPRREMGGQFALIEQAWLPELAKRLPIAVPAPIRLGSPSAFYPWAWSVVPWIDGEPAYQAPPARDAAEELGKILRALHQPAPKEAPRNPHRGGSIQERADQIESRVAKLEAETSYIEPDLIQIWRAGSDAPAAAELTWLHGDLHPKNILVKSGSISAIIDWSDLTAGDPALDLAAAWMLFEDPAAQLKCLEVYDADPNAQARSKAWAIYFGVMFLSVGLADSDSGDVELGCSILRKVANSAR